MDSLRILLLNPPVVAASSTPLLNLAYLAAVLRKNGHKVRIVDATAPYKRRTPEDVNQVIEDFNPDFIGVTLTISYIPQSYCYLKKLRLKGVPIVAGGPHPNACPQEVLKNGADIVCIGEGENTVIEIAEHFMGKRDLSAINGICYQDEKGGVIFTEPRPLIKDLDTIPFPDLSDFPISHYTGSQDPLSNPLFWSIFSSRGCPFDCTFCSSHNVFGRTIRTRSAHNVFMEIRELCRVYGVRTVAFQDDEILCKKERFFEFCRLMIDSAMDVRMSVRTRIDSIDPELLALAKAAGITRFSFGIESWDDETLLKINKKYKVAAIHKHFKYIAEAQPLPVSFNNIIGFPWETRRHYENTIREIRKIPSNIKFFMTASTPIPFPKTKLYDDYKDKYGFTDWWLDPDKHTAEEQIRRTEPFFIKFAEMFDSLYLDDMYWKYSERQKKDIAWCSWTLFGIFLRRRLGFLEYWLLMPLCRISHWLWRKNKPAEIRLFSHLGSTKYFVRIRGKLQFTDKY